MCKIKLFFELNVSFGEMVGLLKILGPTEIFNVFININPE